MSIISEYIMSDHALKVILRMSLFIWSRVGERPVDEFVSAVNAAIYRYPGNAHRELKTINNWRTEISALFGFIEHTESTDRPGRRALELARNQDLVESFKIFLYNFQYPGAHIKPKNVLEQIEAGIHFKPAQYILKLLKYANREGGNSFGITKFEACHCIFNDLRVTRDNEGAEKTWTRIMKNREEERDYDQTGDVVRYAGDILAYIAADEQELKILKESSSESGEPILTEFLEREEAFEKRIGTIMDGLSTKDIGDIGEGLVHGHECMRVKLGGREDLIHLIKKIPTQYAVGYDISSVELDERKRYIEVKTTISSKPIHFNRIRLTKNEWNTASSTHDRYYVYRLLLSKNERKLFVLQDPVGLYKKDLIDMIPSDGADITFDPKKVGTFEELLTWKL